MADRCGETAALLEASSAYQRLRARSSPGSGSLEDRVLRIASGAPLTRREIRLAGTFARCCGSRWMHSGSSALLTIGSGFETKASSLMKFKPSATVLLETSHDRSHRSRMLTSKDHRELAERCLRLAKACTKPSVAEQLMMLAASYLELAERALRLHEPATAIRLSEIESRRAACQHGDALRNH